MIFTQQQILDMLDIMKRYELIFIAQQLGLQFLSQNDIAILLSAGIDVNQFKNTKGDIEYAFLFGLLAQAIGDDRAKKMNYKQFKQFVASKNFVPLNEVEEYALQQVKSRAYTDITNLGARMRTSLANSALRNNQQQAVLVQQVIKKKTIEAIKLRKGARGLAADLAETSKDWEVDWLRIAYYLTHEAYNTGRAQSILREYGKDAEVWFDVYEGACEKCKELYLTDPNDDNSEPIVFKLEDIIANGNNIGRKKADWLPTISPTHPYCFNSSKTKIYTSRGWKNISDIKIGDLVLTHRNRFRKVTDVIVHDYDGEDLYNINYLNSDNSKFEVKYITGNHPIFTLRGWVPVRDLTLNDTIFNSSLICSNCGKKINIQKNSTHLLKKELCLNCSRKFSAENQWKNDDFKNYVIKSAKKQMNERYSTMSDYERKEITKNARKELKRKYGNTHPWMADAIKKANKTNGKKRTFIERKLLHFCKRLGVEAVTNLCLKNKDKRFRNNVVCYFPDIFIPKFGIIIEADGGFWHRNKKDYDLNRDKDIKEFFGFDTFRFSDDEILNNGKMVYNELKRIFNNHSGKYKINKAKIVSIERVEKNTRCSKLYNISVDEDESYIADGIIVHNCRCTINYKRPGYLWDAILRAFNKPTKIVSKNKKLQGIDKLIKVTK